MKYLLAVLVVLGVALGVAGVVAGEADDSPGLQGLGAVLALSSAAFGVRTVQRSGRTRASGHEPS